MRQNKLHIKQPQHRIDHDNAELDPHCIFNTKQKICVVLKITGNIGCGIYFHKSKKFRKLSSHLASHMSSHVNFGSCLVGWKRYLRIYRDRDISQPFFCGSSCGSWQGWILTGLIYAFLFKLDFPQLSEDWFYAAMWGTLIRDSYLLTDEQ